MDAANDLTVVALPGYYEGMVTRFSISSALITGFTASPPRGDPPLNVSFTDLSAGLPVTWSWDFGDGTRILQNRILCISIHPRGRTR